MDLEQKKEYLFNLDLIQAKKEFDPIAENSKNPFFKSKYANLSECIKCVSPSLLDNGFSISNSLRNETIDCRAYIVVSLTLTHYLGHSISSQYFIAREHILNADSKNTKILPAYQSEAGVITYARRYLLLLLLGLATEDIVDEQPDQSKSKPLSKEEMEFYDLKKELTAFLTPIFKASDDFKKSRIKDLISSKLGVANTSLLKEGMLSRSKLNDFKKVIGDLESE